MIYFKPKSDLIFIVNLKTKIEELWKYEDEIKKDFEPSFSISGMEYFIAVENIALKNLEYKKLRELISKSLPHAEILTDEYNTPLKISPFHETTAHHIFIIDNLNRLIGQCEKRKKSDFLKIINPFYLLYLLVSFILKIPFILIKLTGFNVSKIEDHLLGKIFKILELLVILYIGYKFGIENSNLLNLIK